MPSEKKPPFHVPPPAGQAPLVRVAAHFTMAMGLKAIWNCVPGGAGRLIVTQAVDGMQACGSHRWIHGRQQRNQDRDRSGDNKL